MAYVVKNTFIDFAYERPFTRTRSSSCPARLDLRMFAPIQNLGKEEHIKFQKLYKTLMQPYTLIKFWTKSLVEAYGCNNVGTIFSYFYVPLYPGVV